MVTRRVKGKVVAPHLGPEGRPRTYMDFSALPIAIRVQMYRKSLLSKGKSSWGPFLRKLEYGQ